MPIEPWETLRSELVFDHRWYRVRRDTVRLANGRVLDDYFVSVRPEIVIVFAVTDSNEVLFVRQYRQGAGAVTLELPGGTFDADSAEGAVGAGARELLEETGYVSSELTLLSSVFADASKNTNQIHTVFGRQATRSGDQDLDESETASGGIDIVLVPLGDLRAMVRSGEIKNESTVLAIYLALEQLGR